MPIAGLSLVGFMEQAQAIPHLRDFCIPADASDATLLAEWKVATARLGAPVANAGQPEILPIPASHQRHIDRLSGLPWVAPLLAANARLGFRMVEIDPLLSFQFTVSTPTSTRRSEKLDHPPTMEQLLDVCLPLQQESEKSRVVRGPQSILLKTDSLNVRFEKVGMIGPGLLGVKVGVDLPLLRVVRHNGRCYLRNGYHRAVGIRHAGGTHVPCLFWDAADIESVGAKTDGTTFSTTFLNSPNPPTLMHFTSGRAHNVSLRQMSKILQVSWSEYVVSEDI